MAAYWQPTVNSYFKRINKNQVIEAVRKGTGAKTIVDLEGMKKDMLATNA